ncbi:RNA methyltransferase [Psychroflexus planctonicus]|uniref:RNA methyltransferase n=1 Tax=Psychroflexus planctonicus TaxID=1526575 RepID=A0ABQ1SI17_9FLAO|nr:RNA methyltransferase [Psychroflexus planctonicus]GGE36367.1 RNA methyltransferase [Psychroflexus planctonicus]
MRKLKNVELDRKSVEEYKAASKTPLIIILDNIRSLNNIGSVFRTADAFLIEKIYLCGITATPPHKDIHKTALGATESLNWEHAESTVDLVKKLQKNNVEVFAIEQAEKAIQLNNFEVAKDKKYAFVFGNEVKGVQQKVVDICNGVIEIPQLGTKHSLNISVSVGVCLWDFVSKLKVLSSSVK